jgi:hypothetical protein
MSPSGGRRQFLGQRPRITVLLQLVHDIIRYQEALIFAELVPQAALRPWSAKLASPKRSHGLS